MKQFCVYTKDKDFLNVISWLREHHIKLLPHLNRTRFWVSDGPIMTSFLLRWSHVCKPVGEFEDYTLGR